jgi:hypothetical protein
MLSTIKKYLIGFRIGNAEGEHSQEEIIRSLVYDSLVLHLSSILVSYNT